MSADPRQVDAHARRLIALLGNEQAFRLDPAAMTETKFGITVRYREDVDSDCDIDGSYDHERRIITVAEAASPSRRRFTVLHELGHALGHGDSDLQDWLFTFAAAGRLEEERVANTFASTVLLPDALVAEHIPDDGPCAFDVVQLAGAATASREAVCVRAAQRLRGAGLVGLARGSVVQFAATRSLPFGIRRGSDQGEGSFFARASQHGSLRETGVHIRFPGTDVTSSSLIGDAHTDAEGYTFVVLMKDSAPWLPLTPIPDGPTGHEIDCELCDATRITFARACPTCGDRPCPEPDHGCTCDQLRRRGQVRRCGVCNAELPSGAAPDQLLCDMCG